MDDNDKAAIIDALSNLAAAISYTAPDSKVAVETYLLRIWEAIDKLRE